MFGGGGVRCSVWVLLQRFLGVATCSSVIRRMFNDDDTSESDLQGLLVLETFGDNTSLVVG
jgi:hypothetical protein